MRIAIIGATSQIGKDLITRFINKNKVYLFLFSRRPEQVCDWLKNKVSRNGYVSKHLDDFNKIRDYDVIINLIGVSDSNKINELGFDVFNIADAYDSMILNYMKKYNSNCKYIFFSSGAAYGNVFSEEKNNSNRFSFSLNGIDAREWYGLTKMHMEIKHRTCASFNICDIRVFSYFSVEQNLKSNFIMSQIMNSLINNETFITNDFNIYRDYIHPDDLFNLVSLIIETFDSNGPIDCYSKGAVSKLDMLLYLSREFNLIYEVVKTQNLITNERDKVFYYTRNKSLASKIGYQPLYTSLESISLIVKEFLVKSNV